MKGGIMGDDVSTLEQGPARLMTPTDNARRRTVEKGAIDQAERDMRARGWTGEEYAHQQATPDQSVVGGRPVRRGDEELRRVANSGSGDNEVAVAKGRRAALPNAKVLEKHVTANEAGLVVPAGSVPGGEESVVLEDRDQILQDTMAVVERGLRRGEEVDKGGGVGVSGGSQPERQKGIVAWLKSKFGIGKAEEDVVEPVRQQDEVEREVDDGGLVFPPGLSTTQSNPVREFYNLSAQERAATRGPDLRSTQEMLASKGEPQSRSRRG